MNTSPLRTAVLATVLATVLGLATSVPARAVELAFVPAQPSSTASTAAFDGVVEAVRQAVIAAQVQGAVVQLDAKSGDRVAAGQVLLRIDARAAEQNAAASAAQVQAARALMDMASKDFDRQKQLFAQNYISRAALERAESEFKSSQAQATSQLAQAGAAQTQSGFYVVRAPFAGVVAEVPVSLGDMAMPGRALLTLYDPASLRVTASVPQTVAARGGAQAAPRVEIPGLPASAAWINPVRTQMLPTVDPATHTVQVRVELPTALAGVTPGMFARVWLPLAAAGTGAAPGAPVLSVASAAIVRRAEMTGLYVLDAQGKPQLRLVRLGRSQGDQVEILTGLSAGERVVSDPQAAARLR